MLPHGAALGTEAMTRLITTGCENVAAIDRVRAAAWRPWVLLLATALAVRLAAMVLLADANRPPHTYEHGEIAANLVAGKGFAVRFLGSEGPTSQQAPVYPALLAGCYGLLGPQTHAAHLAMQGLQALLGTLLVAAVTILTWRLLDRPAYGWAAGWLAAVHPVHVYLVTQFHAALCVAALLAAALAWAAVAPMRRSAAGALGILLGLLVLTDPIMALAVPGIGWLFGRQLAANGGAAIARRRLAMAGVAGLLVMAPWLVRNRLVHGEWVFVKSTFGYAFWQGNNAHSWGTDKLPYKHGDAHRLRADHDGTLAGRERALWEARDETLYIDDVLLKPDGYARFAGLSEPERSRLLLHEALACMDDDPAAYLRRCLRRLRYFVLFDETNPKTFDPLYRLTTLAGLALAVAGAWRLRRQWRRLAPVAWILAAVTVFHVLTITSPRFRVPLEPLAMVFASAALVRAPRRGEVPPGRDRPSSPLHSAGRPHAALGQHAEEPPAARCAGESCLSR